MKHLLLFFLFSGSLDCFSQAPDTTQPLNQFDIIKWGYPITDSVKIGTVDTRTWTFHEYKPDTIRATLIVYKDLRRVRLRKKPGYVVWMGWKLDCYLDDKKRAIKSPWEVLTFRIKK